jgi:hypothetical protein
MAVPADWLYTRMTRFPELDSGITFASDAIIRQWLGVHSLVCDKTVCISTTGESLYCASRTSQPTTK